MDSPQHTRRISGALRFVRDLHAFADECAALGVWDDDLTARRRRRDDVRVDDARTSKELQVKVL